MTAFIDLIVSFYTSIIGLFNSTIIELGGYNVSFGSVIFSFIAIYMVVSLYWRGAKG